MLYQFDTDSLKHAKAALLLYAMYRSRESNSSLNGKETWKRCGSYVRGAYLKSTTTAEFVQHFCHKAGVLAIQPRYLDTGEPVLDPGTGELFVSEGVKNYATGIVEDNSLLPLYGGEAQYIILLVRNRIQWEKVNATEEEDHETED